VIGTPLMLDVDTGVDDAIAIALAVARETNLVGISTVAGNVSVDVATRNTLDVLSHLGRSDVPVHRGASRPLVASFRDALHVHGDNGLGGMRLAASAAAEAATPGPAAIILNSGQHAGDLTLVTLGPLTNLAIALNVRPGIVDQVRHLVVMGGAFSEAGNVTPLAEFNMFVDPHAARQVLAAPWPRLTVVGLDVTHRVAFPRGSWADLPENVEGITGLVKGIMRRTFLDRGMDGFYLHDPLAVAVALDPSLVAGEACGIDVATRDAERGRTTATPGTGNALVAAQVDAARFGKGFADELGVGWAAGDAKVDRAE
jgi:inosine-uridine nucleoside N-ribohydrolase